MYIVIMLGDVAVPFRFESHFCYRLKDDNAYYCLNLSAYPFNTLQASDILKMCMKKFKDEN